jgi:hypothetical protein
MSPRQATRDGRQPSSNGREATRKRLRRHAPEVEPANEIDDELPADIDPATGEPWSAIEEVPFDVEDIYVEDDDEVADIDGEGETQPVPPGIRVRGERIYQGERVYQSRPGAAAAERAGELAHRAADLVTAPAAKELRTSEFLVWGLSSLSILVAALFSDTFNAGRAWTLIAVVSAAYIVSRGIAKAGTARGWDDGPR